MANSYGLECQLTLSKAQGQSLSSLAARLLLMVFALCCALGEEYQYWEEIGVQNMIKFTLDQIESFAFL